MKLRKIGLAFGVALALWSCVDIVKPTMFKWMVSMDFPITSKTIVMKDYLKDPKIQEKTVNVNGTVVDNGFVFSDTVDIPEQSVGDQFSVNDMTPQHFVQNVEDVQFDGMSRHFSNGFDTVGVAPVSESVSSILGPVTMNDTEPDSTAPIAFTDLVNVSAIPDGNPLAIAQGKPIPVIYRNVSFSEFTSATFITGQLRLNIINDLVIELGSPITVSLLNTDSTIISGGLGGDAIAQWTAGINPGNQAQEDISLGGKTIPDSIIVKIEGVVCGTAARNDITNTAATRASSFMVTIQAINLEVSSAMAEIPEQVIDTTDVIQLEPSNNLVERSRIQDGTLSISVQNNVAIDADLVLSIPSIDTTDTEIGPVDTLRVSVPLPANQLTAYTKSLSGYYLTMDQANQAVKYSYRIKTRDTGTNKVLVSENDGVNVDIHLYGAASGQDMTFSTYRGTVDQAPLEDSGEIRITSDSDITSAVMGGGSLTIVITNNINTTAVGAPDFVISLPQFLDQNETAIVKTTTLLPGANTISVPLAGYTLVPQRADIGLPTERQFITYGTQVTLPAGISGSYNLLDSMLVDVDISGVTFTSVTGYFNQNAMVDSNSIQLDTDIMVNAAVIQSGEMVVTVQNNVGIVADVDFTVDELFTPLGEKMTEKIHLTDTTVPVEKIIPLVNYTLDLPAAAPGTPQNLDYVSSISLPSDQQMTLNFGQDINVTVEMRNLSFRSVIGNVDSIEVNIDPVEQTIDALPEEMKGVKFSQVDMTLQLNTDISIPLYLDLDVKAGNADGDSASIHVNDRILPGQPLSIPGAETLINIFPNVILAKGHVIADGSGQIKSTDVVSGTMNIAIPLVFNLSDPVSLDLAPELNNPQDIPEELENALIHAKINSGFDFDVSVDVLAARDTTDFETGTGVDTIASLYIPALDTTTQTLDLSDYVLSLLKDSVYIKNNITLMGNGPNSRILATDSLSLRLYGTVDALVDVNKDTTSTGGAQK